QAEDGIRDRTVTGVQTCALPILPVASTGRRSRTALKGPATYPTSRRSSTQNRDKLVWKISGFHSGVHWCRGVASARRLLDDPSEIGRASCRERVEMSVVAGGVIG